MVCPQCDRPKLYFNVNRKVGYCHYAACSWHINPPRLRDLIQIVGYGPEDDAGATFVLPQDTDRPPVNVRLPEGSSPLVYMDKGTLMTTFPLAMEAVASRGVSAQDQFRFQLHFNGLYVYLPVFSDGKLVSYLGRLAWWFEAKGLRYDNATGTETNSYLHNWDEAKHWKRLTLVENTFNAIAYRNVCQTVSTFGSTLTEKQCKLIAGVPVQTVALMWDEGTKLAAGKVVDRLRTTYGIRAAAGWMEGQPDDHPLEWVMAATDKVHKAAWEGEPWVRLPS